MLQFTKQCRQRVNAVEWRGFAAGTVMLASRRCTHNRKAKLTFFVRDEGYDVHSGGTVFKVYESASFKYALRGLHRRGFRNVKITVKRASTQTRWLNQDGVSVATP